MKTLKLQNPICTDRNLPFCCEFGTKFCTHAPKGICLYGAFAALGLVSIYFFPSGFQFFGFLLQCMVLGQFGTYHQEESAIIEHFQFSDWFKVSFSIWVSVL